MAEESSRRDGWFKTSVAVLIAIVAISSAAVAWRAAVHADDADNADLAGLAAVLNAEGTRTSNDARYYQHYAAYTSYVQHKGMGQLVDWDLGNQAYSTEDPTADPLVAELSRRREEAFDQASISQLFLVTRYLDNEEQYDGQSELAEAWADAARWQDLNPEPHFAQADQLRDQSNRLVGTLVVFAMALWFCTLASAVKHFVKYGFALAGLSSLAVAVVLALRVEALL